LAVKAGFTAFNDAAAYYIPIYYDPTAPWITGTWNNNPLPNGLVDTTSTNATQYISSDNTHPPDPGTTYVAGRIATAIVNVVLPYLN
jgi:hypothetical protein